MIEVVSAGPSVTVQDLGRPGHLAQGLARGGAADRRALAEAAALLGADGAGLEVPGVPLTLRFAAATTVALTGAPMAADLSGRALAWHASHAVPAGDLLRLRPTGQGVYSYVTPGGGIGGSPVMGSRAAHLIAGIGRALAAGDVLEAGGSDAAPRVLDPAPERFDGGELRIVATPQTRLFAPSEIARFQDTAFIRDPRGNRQGVRLAGGSFAAEGQLALLSDFILPGDVQLTGDGVPYILGPECQTTGGYPRIGTVIAADLLRALQAPPGATLRFRLVEVAEARAAAPGPPRVRAAVTDPRLADLAGGQLIGGVVSAREE